MRTRAWLVLAVSSSMLAVAACSGDSAGVANDPDAGGGSGADSGSGSGDGGAKDSGGSTTDSGPGTDSGPKTDSGTVDFPCQATPLPTTAPATVTVSGGVADQSAGGTNALANATVDAYGTQTSTTSIASTLSGSTGAFSLDLTTGGVPLDGYLKITKTNELDTYLYPNQPLASDQSKLAAIMITPGTLTGLSALAGVSQDAAKGLTAVEVLDCAGNSLAGATVTSTAGGTTKYDASGFPSSTATSTAADGLGYIFNMTPGDATIMVSVGGKPYRTHHVFTRAGTFTITLATP